MKTKKLVLGGLLIALNILLPRLFLLIPNGGKLFLPMHFGVLAAGLLLGPAYGALIGFVAPLLGLLINGMPQMPMAAFMMLELAAYGGFSGLLLFWLQKTRLPRIVSLYFSLAAAMVIGRLTYAGVLLFSGLIAIQKAPAVLTVFSSFLTGLPGIAIQLVLIPAVTAVLQKALQLPQTERTKTEIPRKSGAEL